MATFETKITGFFTNKWQILMSVKIMSVKIMSVTSLRGWLNVGNHFEMLATKQHVDDIFLDVGDQASTDEDGRLPCGQRTKILVNGDIPIGYQHHARMWCWWPLFYVDASWCSLSSESQTCHQHICSPTSVTNELISFRMRNDLWTSEIDP